MRFLIASIIGLVAFSCPVFAELKHDIVYERVMASKTIRCGYAEYGAFLTVDPNTHEVDGIMKEVMDEIGKRTGLKIEWTAPVGWGEITTAANSGKIDLFCNTVWTDKAQLQNMTLTRPLFYAPTYAFVRKGDTRFDNAYEKIDDPKVTIVGIDGDTTYVTMQDNFPKAKMFALPNEVQIAEVITSVVAKKGDVFLSDWSLVDDYEKMNPGKIQRVKGGPLFIMQEVLVTRAGEQQLKNVLDIVIQSLINEGFFDKLFKKYKVRSNYAPRPDVVIPDED